MNASARRSVIPPFLLERIARAERLTRARAAASRTLVAQSPGRRATIDASGQPKQAGPPGHSTLDRSISDADGADVLPGTLVRSEGEPATDDRAVNEAYEGLGRMYSLFHEVFRRSSIDGRGMPLRATVHYGRDYDNAFWNGTRMVFGDGDGEVFRRFTVSLSIIGHELTHGVTEHTTPLRYAGQSGALSESVSDVFGCLVEQYTARQSASAASWLVGEGIFTDQVQGAALRSLRAPGTAYDDDVLGKDPQPATMAEYVETDEDDGGVHVNSGIPNHAFYLFATALGGAAWEQAGHVWYDALTGGMLNTDATFADFARVTTAAARSRFTTDVAEALHDVWRRVGVVDGRDAKGSPARPGTTSTVERIVIERFGGVAGMTRSWQVNIDGRRDADRLRTLIEALPAASHETTVAIAPDRFRYRIRCTSDGGQHDVRDVTVAETELTPVWQELIDRVRGSS